MTTKSHTPSATDAKQSGHTPLPWRLTERHDLLAGNGDDQRVLAVMRVRIGDARDAFKNHEELKANANFIVRAVNSHYELLEALEAWQKAWRHIPENLRKHFILANNRTASALAKATEGGN